MKKVFLAIVIMAFATNLSAQNATKSVYMELGGPSITAFNFDTRLSKKTTGLGARAGFGGFVIDGEGVMFFPLGFNYLLSKDNKNYFEIGVGATLLNGSERKIFSSDNESAFGHFSFGYRYQPAKGGFVFRAAVTPVFGQGYFIPYYGGISFGYAF